MITPQEILGYGLAALLSLAAPGLAAPLMLRGPELAAASNFNQGWDAVAFEAAKAAPVRDFRDGIYWKQVEREPGRLRFDRPTTSYPLRIQAIGASMSLTVNWGNPLYDGGDTPHSPGAVAAFARFAAAAAETFPAIHAIEVGNEFNGTNFVAGPVKAVTSTERAGYYTTLLKATYAEVKRTRPGVAVLGGATHSIPAGYLWRILDLGGAEAMDEFALHPYTTPPEQLIAQIEVLRRHPAAAGLPIQVTEFGESDQAQAAGYLFRNYCQMALSGVTRAAWYPMNDRGDGLVPLVDPSGTITPAGRAYTFAARLLAGRPVRDAAPDPFTYACLFDQDTLVIWGEPRSLTLEPGLAALDPEGQALDPEGLALSMESPVVVIAPGGGSIRLGENVRLGAQTILADSFHQFGYPKGEQCQAPGDGFERFLRRNGHEIPLRTFPGQERPGTLWTPYRANQHHQPAWLTATALLPARRAGLPTEVIHRFRANREMTVSVDAAWEQAEPGKSGVTVTIRQGDTVLDQATATSAFRFERPRLALGAGDVLDFAVGPGNGERVEGAGYRITIRSAE